MAQADTSLHMTVGESTGSLEKCQRCGGRLEGPTDGTNPDDCEDVGGFQETYQCQSCNKTGTYKYRYKDGKQAYLGVCADYQ